MTRAKMETEMRVMDEQIRVIPKMEAMLKTLQEYCLITIELVGFVLSLINPRSPLMVVPLCAIALCVNLAIIQCVG